MRHFRNFSARLFVLCIGLAAIVAGGAQAQEKLLTADDIRAIAPHAGEEFIEALVDAEAAFEAAGIDTRLRMAHFIAQVMTETGGLGRIDENMNYSYASLMRVFSRRTVSDADARRIARKPREVANWVYGARLGNRGRHTEDGWNYRGSGFIQLTGRDNFIRRAAEIGIPLDEFPELARSPEAGLAAAIAYWQATGLNAAADANNRLLVRRLVNGPAAHGKEQARVWFNSAWVKVFAAKEALGFEGGDIAPEADVDALYDDILTSSLLSDSAVTSTEMGDPTGRESAIRDYQNVWGLPETGILDDATQEALLDPRNWRHQSSTYAGNLADNNPTDTPSDAVVATNTQTPTIGDPDSTVSFAFGAAAADDAGVTSQPEQDSGTVTESGMAPSGPIAAHEGTGQMARHTQIKKVDVTALLQATAMYAPYEVGDRASGTSTFVPYSVIGTDDRLPIADTTEFPASAIVEIILTTSSGQQSVCSGAMVSADTVLTAAHCIHSGTQDGQFFQSFRVLPGRSPGSSPFGACNVIGAHILNGWAAAQNHLDARDYDLGALKLDCDIGLVTGQFGVRVLKDTELGLGTAVQGYAIDRAPAGRQWVSTDEIRVLTETKGFYDNDTFGGTSGSIVTAVGQNQVAIGVHTNGLHGEFPWSTHNAFTRITERRLNEIAKWISE